MDHTADFPAGHLDAEGNLVPLYDELGGYYDEVGAYIDTSGNMYPRPGHEFTYDEQGRMFMSPIAEAQQDAVAEAEQQAASEELSPEDLLRSQCYYDEDGTFIAPPGYELQYDEAGNAFIVPTSSQQPQDVQHEHPAQPLCTEGQEQQQAAPEAEQEPVDDASQVQCYYDAEGHLIAPAGYDVHYDELGYAYLVPQQPQQSAAHEVHAELDNLAVQMRDFALTESRADRIARIRAFVEQKQWKADDPSAQPKITAEEKQQLRMQYQEVLQVLGANCRRLFEEKIGLRKIPKPTILRMYRVTYIAAPDNVTWVYPYHLRRRYPGYVRDIEAIEGSFDPKLFHVNPPIHPSKRDPNQKYPEPYVGLQAPPPKEKKPRPAMPTV